jgi:hypothetical protein
MRSLFVYLFERNCEGRGNYLRLEMTIEALPKDAVLSVFVRLAPRI